MKTNALELTKRFSCVSAVVLMFGLGVASAQTTNFPGSVTIGSGNNVSSNSLAVGEGNMMYGANSFALGGGVGSVVSRNCLSGNSSIVQGSGCYAEANYSAVFNASESDRDGGFAANVGYVTMSYNVGLPYSGGPTGYFAAALNNGVSIADYSFAANNGTALNKFSAAFGLRTQTASPAQFVVGMYNNVIGTNEDWTTPNDFDDSSWSQTDALFIVGNGNSGTPSDAMQVRMDGMVLINPSGELGTGSYTNGPTP